MKVWPGAPHPLGAEWDGEGTNFSLFSEVAEAVELCLFDDAGEETARVELPERYAWCWHGYLPGVGPGQRYGFRVHGPWAPEQGHRCDPCKLLLDPYAKAIEGAVDWNEAVFSHRFDDPEGERNRADSAPFVPRSVVIDPGFDWGGDRRPDVPLHETIVYELHVKGFTARLPDVPEGLRGTYAGLAHPAAIAHLERLGVTTVELMPIHRFVHAKHLVDRGLRNYWGYDSIGFFAPHDEYSSRSDAGGAVTEFREMVAALHRAGIEVFVDVVYNHTAEGNHLGPVLGFKGIDNAAYYRLDEDDRRHYRDFTGTGNSLNMRHPQVLQMLMDSLRYWIVEMHVDGFRFDLASALARELHEVDRLSSFFDVIHQDPVVSQAKLIAEPWDVGEGGYQVGNFPPLWAEWNGRYRDTVRDFWRGRVGVLGEMASRLVGSSDLYEDTGRRPFASVNFVTAHDGYTLEDLVCYDSGHDASGGEAGAEGASEPGSWNGGIEGPSEDPGVRALRDRQKRNLLATLLLSQGVPMILAGDELGRSQGGNDNAYCRDDALSWIDWEEADHELARFVRRLIALRRAHPVLRRRRWLTGRAAGADALPDVGWVGPDGREMEEEDWNGKEVRSVGVFLNGDAIATRGRRGERIEDDTLLLVPNAGSEEIAFRLPPERWGRVWEVVLDTADPGLGEAEAPARQAGETLEMAGRSLVLMRRAD